MGGKGRILVKVLIYCVIHSMNPLSNKQDEPNALDSLEKKLNNPRITPEPVARHTHSQPSGVTSIPNAWTEDRIVSHIAGKEKKFSFGILVLLVSFIALFVALSFTAWRVMSSRNVVSSGKISVTIDSPPSIEGGESVPFVVTLQNLNEASLEEATLSLQYKQGTGSQNEEEKVVDKREMGSINSKEYRREDFSVMVYGSEGEARDFTVILSYKVTGSNAVFSKTVLSSVIIKTPPLSVDIEGPSVVSLGQDSTYKVIIKNTTSTTSRRSLLIMTMPTTFTITSSSPPKNERATSWIIEELAPGETKEITIVGNISGMEGEVATMKGVIGSLGGSVSDVDVVYASYVYDITLRQAPLTLSFALDTERGRGDTLQYGDRATLSIFYSNKSSQSIRDASLLLSLSGDAADLSGVLVENDKGYYDSIRRTVEWNKSTLSNLSVIAPGAEGVVRVVIPIVSRGNNTPSLIASVIGTASNQITDDVTIRINKTWNVQGTASVRAETHYKNTSLPNTGPIPPEPNRETTYTTRLFVSAQNALSSATVSFTLPVYVSWQNVASDPSHISYNSRTRTVTWSIGAIEAGKSVVSDIKLSVKPSQSQVNQVPQITSSIVFDAQEEISRARIKTTLSPLTTTISGEGYSNESFRVMAK